MINLPNDLCCGCSACEQSCPIKCISMQSDGEGFLRPVIDNSRCLNCGVCEDACPILTQNTGHALMDAYGCTLKNTSDLVNSTSGGVFSALADYVLKNDGAVYGAAYNDNLEVAHERITDINLLHRLRKSKYSQSDLSDSFSKIKADLLNNKLVLFTGTPCQIAGLNCFLKKDYPNLILMQVFCAEVVSPLSWKRYVEYINDAYKIEAKSIDTRSKSRSIDKNNQETYEWKKPLVQIIAKSNEVINISREKDWFTLAFAEHLIARKSCFNCQFKITGHKIFADISIGDFWGCENNAPECFNSAGVSAVIIHTDKGRKVFSEIESALDLHQVKPEVILAGNPGVVKSHKPHKSRNECFEMLNFEKNNFEQVIIKALGLDENLLKCNYKIGLFGSYNTRAAISAICSKSNCTLSYQYSNCSLISLFSDPVELPDDMILPHNPYRAEMLVSDFDKRFVLSDGIDKQVDYLIIDFLEERFDIVETEKGYLTYSDSMTDSNYVPERVVDRLSADLVLNWNEKCLRFISHLRKCFSESTIIIVESYLADSFQNENGDLIKFDSSYNKLAQMNEILFHCYDFFKTNMPEIKVISHPDSMKYCECRHKHGVFPWHFNQEYYNYLSKEIAKLLI